MPIIGFTDDLQPRFPRLGKLRKGGEKTEKGYGPDLDHFRFVAKSPELQAAFNAAFGDKPRAMTVYAAYPTIEETFPVWSEVWTTSGLQHRCDGKTCQVWLNGDKYSTEPKPCPGGHKDNDPLKNAIGRLQIVMPELLEAGYVGYVTLETHSKHDILNILGVLNKVMDTAGTLEGIAFVLRRVKENISTPGFGERKGQRSRVDKWLVTIEPAAEWVRARLSHAHASQMLVAGEALALPEALDFDEQPEPEALDVEYRDAAPEPPAPTPPPPPTAAKPAQPKPQPPKASVVNPAASRPAQIEAALNACTSKGTPLAALTDEQLQLIADKSTNNNLKAAAKLLLSPAGGDDWITYYALAERAGKSKVDAPELPDKVSLATMLCAMRDVTAKIDAIEEDIPGGF